MKLCPQMHPKLYTFCCCWGSDESGGYSAENSDCRIPGWQWAWGAPIFPRRAIGIHRVIDITISWTKDFNTNHSKTSILRDVSQKHCWYSVVGFLSQIFLWVFWAEKSQDLGGKLFESPGRFSKLWCAWKIIPVSRWLVTLFYEQ